MKTEHLALIVAFLSFVLLILAAVSEQRFDNGWFGCMVWSYLYAMKG